MPKTTTDKLTLAGVLAALVSILAMRVARLEAYETETVATVGMMAALLLAGLLGGGMKLRRPSLLEGAVLALVGVTGISTLLAIDPLHAFWGSDLRAQGFVTLGLYGLIFWGASRRTVAQHLPGALMPLLVLLMAVLTVLAFHDRIVSDIARPRSAAGNPNYLSSWMVMAGLFSAALVLDGFWRRRGWRAWVLPLTVVVQAVGLFALTTSRGALLGMIVGAALFAVGLALLSGRRRVALGLLVLGLIGAGAYGVAAANLRVASEESGVLRLLRPYDEPRLDIWGRAAVAATRFDLPTSGTAGEDRWRGLRGAIGYGPEMVEYTQARYGQVMTISGLYFLDSFHNHLWDALYMTGWLGLLAWLLLIEAVAWAALRSLGFLRGAGPLLTWFGGQLVVMAAAWGLLLLVLPDGTPAGAMLGLAAGVGLGGGMVAALALQAPPQRAVDGLPTRGELVLLGALAAVVAHWVDVQFGFVQAASQPLWWVMIGLVAGLTPDVPDELPEAAPALWWGAAFAAGAMLIPGTGVTLDGQVMQHQLYEGMIWWLLLGMLAIVLVAVAGRPADGTAATGKSAKKRRGKAAKTDGGGFRVDWVPLVAVVGGWAVLLGLKFWGVAAATSQFDAAVRAASSSGLRGAFLTLGVLGVIGAVAGVIGWIVAVGAGRSLLASPGALVIGVGVLVLASSLYTVNFTASSLHSMGIRFTGLNQPEPLAVAGVAYEAAASLTPRNERLRLDWSKNLLARGESEEAEAQLAALFERGPFFNNTMEWRVFSDNFSNFQYPTW